MKRAVVLLSGGIDSTTLAYHLKYHNRDLLPICINYGQRHKKEIQAAEAIANSLERKLEVIDLSSSANIFAGSALTSDIKVPEGYYTDKNMAITVVPNRNMVFISLAVAYALSHGADTVAYAAHSGDHAIYPDCRPEFADYMIDAVSTATDREVTLSVPFLYLTKADIVKIGLNKNYPVPYELTWSCYNGREKHCGKCGTCVERLEAFKLNQAIDPVKYE